MNTKPVDKSKKSNIKCEHCEHWDKDEQTYTSKLGYLPTCAVSGEPKCYYNRCKNFEWAEIYMDGEVENEKRIV